MIGKTISHYKILEKLGEGGMGVVYKARDLDLDRFVAIKVLPPHFSTDEDAIKRFVHEAKAASSLNHSNIGVIHEIGRTGDGQTFIVMACYEGETLRERIDRGGITLEEALDIASQIAAGLAKSHEKEIVHRDIKPSNILVTSDGEVKIIDFGLAKLAGRTRLTKEGSTVGTAAYMSPEQARGEDVDHRSDIFSLGVILYEMLAGSPPFKGEHEAALLYEIVHEEPEPLSDYRGGLPHEYQTIVDSALHKDPADRHQSAADLKIEIDTLKELLRDSADTKKSGQQRAGGSKIKWQAGIVIIAVVCITVILTSLYMSRQREVAPAEELSLAVMDFRYLTVQDDPAFSAGITELVYIGLVETSPIRIQSPEYVQDLRRRLFGSANGPIQKGQALEIARKSGATYVLTGRIGTLGDERFITWRLVDVQTGKSIGAKKVESDKMSTLANEIVGAVLPLIARYSGIEEPIEQVPVEQITTDKSPAYQHYINGRLLQRQKRPEEALEEYEQAIALDSSFSLAYLGISRLHFGESLLKGFNISEAKCYADLSWKYRSRLGIKDRMWLDALRHSIDYRVSEEISILREIHERWPDDREAIYNLITRCYFWGLLEETVAMTEKGLQLFPDDKYIGGGHLGALAGLGRIDEAFRATLAYIEKNPENPDAWDDLALRYLAMGRPDSAEAAYRKALEIDPDWGEFNYAVCAYHAGHLEKAIDDFERILGDGSLEEHERMRLILPRYGAITLSALYLEAGRYGDVMRVCDEYLKSVGEDPVSLYFIGRLYVAVGQTEKASAMVREMSRSDKVGMQVHALNIRGNLLSAAGNVDEARKTAAQLHEWAETRGFFLHSHAFEIETAIALTANDHRAASEALESWNHGGIFNLGLIHIEHLTMLASAYRLAGHTEKAVEVHEELLRIFGGHALSHYELGKLYEEMERHADACSEYEIFLEMWSQADEGLPQLEDGRRRLASLTSD